MGLSKPLPRRKVDKMKRMPRRENMDVTLSVIIIALTWLGVAFTAMTGEWYLLDLGKVLDSVNSTIGLVL